MPEFIEKHSSEVNNMLFAEYDPVEARKVAIEEGYEDGFEDGLTDGHGKGLAEGHKNGLSDKETEIVRRMKRNGRRIEDIVADTGMSAEQVELL
jgi:predicted transposase YdaD